MNGVVSVKFARRLRWALYLDRVMHLFVVAATALGLAGCQPDKSADAKAAPAVLPPTQVVAVAAKAQSVAETLSLVGTLAANESVEIKSETDGVVQEILFKEGEQAKKGDLLVRLDESKLAASVAESEANFKLSRANFDRARQLLKDQLISQQEFDQAAATFSVNEAGLGLKKRELADTRIYAPFEGTVSARTVSPGQVISKSTALTWLIDLDPMKAEVNVPERFLGQLQIGQKLEFSVAAFVGRKFNGEVYFISPFVEGATRTALVKARIANPEGILKPGMFASMDLTLTLRENAVVIPEGALLQSGDRTTILVVDAEQKAQIRPVKPGVRLAGVVEIIEGLKVGEMVIVEGLQKARPGGVVKVVTPESQPGARK